MAFVLPPLGSTGAILPLLVVGDIVAVAWYRRHASWPHLVRVLPWAAVGVIIGWRLLGHLTDAAVKPLIGGIVLAMLALHHVNRALNADGGGGWFHRRWFSIGIGLVAGVTTMVANAAGPVMALYLVAMGLPKDVFIGTAAWYFFIINLYKIPFSASLNLVNPDSLRFDLVLAPCVLAGGAIGILVARRIPEKAFGILVQILAAAAAVKLLIP
jgi:uncharacterized membrane protein YfcA